MIGPFVIEVHDHQRYGEAMVVRTSSQGGGQTTFRCRYQHLDGTRCTYVWTSDVSWLTNATYVMTVDAVKRARPKADEEVEQP